MATDPGDIPCICFQTRRAARNLTQIFDRHLRTTGLHAIQYGMLRCLSMLERPSLAEIGKFMSMDQSTVSRNIEALICKRLAASERHKDDPRKKIVRLTEKGRSMVADATVAWENAQNEIRDMLGEADLQTLLKLLDRISRDRHGRRKYGN